MSQLVHCTSQLAFRSPHVDFVVGGGDIALLSTEVCAPAVRTL